MLKKKGVEGASESRYWNLFERFSSIHLFLFFRTGSQTESPPSIELLLAVLVSNELLCHVKKTERDERRQHENGANNSVRVHVGSCARDRAGKQLQI